jgi:hypothetical protein
MMNIELQNRENAMTVSISAAQMCANEWFEDSHRVAIERDQLVADFNQAYHMILWAFVDMLQRVKAIEAGISRINRNAPGNVRRIEDLGKVMQIIAGTRLVNYERPSEVTWPQPTSSIAASAEFLGFIRRHK